MSRSRRDVTFLIRLQLPNATLSRTIPIGERWDARQAPESKKAAKREKTRKSA